MKQIEYSDLQRMGATETQLECYSNLDPFSIYETEDGIYTTTGAVVMSRANLQEIFDVLDGISDLKSSLKKEKTMNSIKEMIDCELPDFEEISENYYTRKCFKIFGRVPAGSQCLKAAIVDYDEDAPDVTISLYSYSDAYTADHYNGYGTGITNIISNWIENPKRSRESVIEEIYAALTDSNYEPEPTTHFVKRFKEIRKKNGYKRGFIGKSVFYHPDNAEKVVREWETEQRPIERGKFQKLSMILGVDLQRLSKEEE